MTFNRLNTALHPKFKLKHWSQGCCCNWQFIWKKKYPCLKMDYPCTLVSSPCGVHWVWVDVPQEDEWGRSETEEMFLQKDGKNQLSIRRESWHVFILSFSDTLPVFSTAKPSSSEASVDHWSRHWSFESW